MSGEGHPPTYAQVLALAELGGASETRMRGLVESVSDAVDVWDTIAAQCGISPDPSLRSDRDGPHAQACA